MSPTGSQSGERCCWLILAVNGRWRCDNSHWGTCVTFSTVPTHSLMLLLVPRQLWHHLLFDCDDDKINSKDCKGSDQSKTEDLDTNCSVCRICTNVHSHALWVPVTGKPRSSRLLPVSSCLSLHSMFDSYVQSCQKHQMVLCRLKPEDQNTR